MHFVLGTVQLGLPYGIANRHGQPDRRQAALLLERAAGLGIGSFDTARAYGESEARLGETLGSSPVTIITKLAPLSAAPADEVLQQARQSLAQSRASLRRPRLDVLLLHRPEERLAAGGAVWRLLQAEREASGIGRLGVSVSTPDEAIAALGDGQVQHLQLPYNFLDWRWDTAAFQAARAARPDVTVHARSVLLQGLLARPEAALWTSVLGDAAAAAEMVEALAALRREVEIEAPVAFAIAATRARAWIDGLVLGVETVAQLDELWTHFQAAPPHRSALAKALAKRPRLGEAVLNPALWPKVK